jgi:hypothetical protein
MEERQKAMREIKWATAVAVGKKDSRRRQEGTKLFKWSKIRTYG